MGEGGRRAQAAIDRTPVDERSRRVYRGHVELVPEPVSGARRYARLRENIADPWSVMFFAAAGLAQLADAFTTWLGLHRGGRFEANFLMRAAVTQPVAVGLLKVLIVVLLSTLVMMRLPVQRARIALLLVFALSLIAPIQNLFQILGS
jgi:hypothetical protein